MEAAGTALLKRDGVGAEATAQQRAVATVGLARRLWQARRRRHALVGDAVEEPLAAQRLAVLARQARYNINPAGYRAVANSNPNSNPIF
jgi:hypothetical protein